MPSEKKRKRKSKAREDEQKRESGAPGGGQGRIDEVGRTGVYPVSASEGASPDAKIQGQTSWGQGERGAAGYEDSGGSELYYYEAELPQGKGASGAGEGKGKARKASQGKK